METSQGGYDAPYLYLGGTRGGDGSSGLPAILKNASSEIISDEITFTYTVEPGDTIAGAILEVAGPYALRGGTVPFVDLLMREINLTLPTMGSERSLSSTSAMSVDSAVPVVTAVSSSLEGGEYGVGQVRPMCSLVPISLLCRSTNIRSAVCSSIRCDLLLGMCALSLSGQSSSVLSHPPNGGSPLSTERSCWPTKKLKQDSGALHVYII